MTFTLIHLAARNISRAMWGRGNEASKACNRRGVFWIETPNNGGMILDAQCLTPAERYTIDLYAKPQKAIAFTSGGVLRAFEHEGRKRTCFRSDLWARHEMEIFTFDRNTQWSIPVHLCGIGPKELISLDSYKTIAKNTFETWYGYDESLLEIPGHSNDRDVDTALTF